MKKTNLRARSFEHALQYFKGTGRPFTVIRTGYTATIDLGDGERYYFSEGRITNPAMFAVARQVKEDVLAAGVPQDVPRPSYFAFDGVQAGLLPPQAWSVDLRSAYAQALHNMRLIRSETFLALQKLPKADRLKAVGMLATSKSFTYWNGEHIVGSDTERSPTAPAFFAACRLIGEVMEDVKAWPGFLLYWVDGAFFDHPATEVADHFAAEGFPCKLEPVGSLRWSKSRRFLFFAKDGEEKYLTLPRGKQPAPQWIAELLSKPTSEPEGTLSPSGSITR